jgi:hypothetical protein
LLKFRPDGIFDKDRELRRVKASELVPNPKNWRRHPKEQAAALKGLLVHPRFLELIACPWPILMTE